MSKTLFKTHLYEGLSGQISLLGVYEAMHVEEAAEHMRMLGMRA
jgi:hypothetical protein